MPIANRTQYAPNSRIVSLQLSNEIPFQQQTVVKLNTEALEFGQVVAYSGANNGTVSPLTATTTDSGATWTLSGSLAGFINATVGLTATACIMVRRGTINADMLRLDLVSQTAGVPFTLADLLKIVELNAIKLDTDSYGGINAINLLGIEGK